MISFMVIIWHSSEKPEKVYSSRYRNMIHMKVIILFFHLQAFFFLINNRNLFRNLKKYTRFVRTWRQKNRKNKKLTAKA
jgi:hypothetical protein